MGRCCRAASLTLGCCQCCHCRLPWVQGQPKTEQAQPLGAPIVDELLQVRAVIE